ncbi:AAA family ATPase [Sphingobacterium corticis]|uniref:AAA family ATPase n=1 Tax=Sphingobacterium corticis TaxID=1812823 RepID=A0ABW5NHE4_9SPHI
MINNSQYDIMPVIYFDNFRGFTDTFLPLKNTNFFVGENSTGKTSVLKLIKIVSDPRFWLMQDFNSEEAELGYFSEILSSNAQKKKYFEIGLLGDSKDKEANISAIKMKFFEKEGQPELREICLIDKTINFQAVIDDYGFKYRHSFIDLDNITESNKLKYFRRWVKSNGLQNKVYTKVNIEGSFFRQAFLLQIDTIISREIRRDDKKNEIKGFKIPSFLRDIAWLAPIRTEPKRTYDNYKINFNPDGTHAPYMLKKLLTSKRSSKKPNEVEGILKKFGQDSGLFEEIKITNLGKSDTSPFEIHIVINGNSLKITNVGYGVSQILPLIVEVIARPKKSWFAIQQPEIHLHPKGQAAFGDFMLKSFLREEKNFIVETHSDYTIDRYRLKMNKNFKEKNENPESQIVFFNRSLEGNKLTCIEIKDDGTLSEDQPKEFREFFIKEQFDLLKV